MIVSVNSANDSRKKEINFHLQIWLRSNVWGVSYVQYEVTYLQCVSGGSYFSGLNVLYLSSVCLSDPWTLKQGWDSFM